MKKYLMFSIVLIFCIFAFNPICKVFAEEQNLLYENITLENFSNFNIITENYYFCVNSEENKIYKIENNNLSSFGEYGKSDGQFATITQFKILKNNQIVVLDSLNRVQFFDTDFNHLKTIQYVLENGTYSNLNNIISICDDIYGNIYLLESNRILTANSTNEYFSIYYKSEKTLTNFIINTNNNLILVYDNTLNLFKREIIENEVNFTLKSTISTEFEISQIFVDALNYIYIKSDSNILKYNTSLELLNTFKDNTNVYYNLNLENGIFYSINPTTQVIEKTAGIASDVLNYTPPVDINNNTANTESLKIAKTTSNAFVYSSPFSATSSTSLELDTQIIILSENFNENLSFSYILYVYENKTCVGYINSENYTLIEMHSEEALYPTRLNVPYYKYPTKSINEQSMQLDSLDFNSTYTSIKLISFNGLDFYEINLNGSFVYVETYNLLNSTAEYINTYLQTNAKIQMFNEIKQVEIYSSPDKSEVQKIITSPLNVKYIKKTSKMCEIQYLDGNGIKTGYVESKFVVLNSTNFTIPIIICLILILLIILAIIIIKFRKEFKQNA